MQPSNKAIDLIKEFESFASKAYLCPAGYLTIGYGHMLAPTDKPLPRVGALIRLHHITDLTTNEASNILQEDLKYFNGYLNEIYSLYQVELKQQQHDALCSFVYNVGHFVQAMLNRFKAKDITAIGNSLTLYNKVGGKVLTGLTRRRQVEKELFFS